jgi:hypothetical protein
MSAVAKVLLAPVLLTGFAGLVVVAAVCRAACKRRKGAAWKR